MDDIDELVDWQLHQRPTMFVVCRVCSWLWSGQETDRCPKCEAAQ